MRRLLFLLLAGLLITACDPPISQGIVTSKTFTPAYSELVPTCYAYGINGCQIWGVTSEFYPDEWTLSLRYRNQTGDIDVNQDTYNQYQVGDYYPRDKG
jgi:hypothetical protein